MISSGKSSAITAKSETKTEETPPAEPKPDVYLPSFWGFAAAAALANAPLFGWLLYMGASKAAFSIAVGLATGLVVYGSLHLFVNRGLDFFLAGSGGRSRPEAQGASILIALILPLKYLVIGLMLYWLYSANAINVAWVTVGFAITQVAVISKSVKRLKSMPLG